MPVSGEKAKPAKPYPRQKAAAGVVLAVAFLVTGIWVYAAHQPAKINPVTLQWSASLTPNALAGLRPDSARFRTALDWDIWALIPGYLAGLLLACYMGYRVFWTRRSHAWAVRGMAAAALAGACNIAQDLLLLKALGDGLATGALLDSAEVLSFVKFAALLVAASVGIAAIIVTSGRLATSNRTRTRWKGAETDCRTKDRDRGTEERPLVIPPPEIEDATSQVSGLTAAEQDWWKGLSTGPQARWAEGFAAPSHRVESKTGVCVSGGGIRSAAVALGALHALREEGVLDQAEYLVSVSGGGYTAGALQLAMTTAAKRIASETAPSSQAPPSCAQATPPSSQATPSDAFAPGSPEEDHLRRHSSYIADGLGQWMVALGVLLRGVLSSLVIIGVTITTVGLAIGEFYGRVPVTAGGVLHKPRFVLTGKNVPAPRYPGIPFGVWCAIAVVGGLTMLAYLIRQLTTKPERMPRASRRAAVLLTVTILLAVLGVALPALLWLSSWMTWPLGFGSLRAATVSSLSLVVTYLGAVVAVFWRKRTTIVKTAGTVTGLADNRSVNQVLPNSMVQLILLWICLAFLILVGLVLCGWAATSGLVHSLWALVPVVTLAALVVIIDQTSLSLHPFYRLQLARAFAVRRVRRCNADIAEPYPADEMTWLCEYGKREPGFPFVTFAATANITKQDRTPPGRRAVPFMLAHDYVGSPATGWVRTDFLTAIAGRYVRNDLTVEAAMAISGAAFASAMGSQTRFYEVFLAIANARLGAWLPNPFFVALKYGNLDNWTIPGLPCKRRLSYFAREIFGIHPSTGRMLLCTDGGHYDNLGLVELLRRRCKVIYCIDASGASVPLADALAGAITLAREELGVEISFTREAYDLAPGGWDQLKPAASFTDLNSRMSKNQVAIGSITYPEITCPEITCPEITCPEITCPEVARCPGKRRGAPRGGQETTIYKKTHGQIVFAQAVLTPDVPYQLLDFPQDDTGFPHDSTGDQFFDAGQFDSYQALGHFIGQKAARRPAAAIDCHPLPKPARPSWFRRPLRMIWLRHSQR